MATIKKKEPLEDVTVKPATKDASGMTAADRVIEANKKPDTKATFTSGKRQETIPGTNSIKEYDATGKLVYIGGNDAQSRMATEQANKPVLSQQEQWKQEFDTKNAKEAYLASLTPPNITPQQSANLGGLSEFPNLPGELAANSATMNDPLTQDILRQQEARAQVKKYPGANLNVASGSIINSIPWVGNTVMSLLEQNPKAREYLSDYSQETNYKAISRDFQSAKKKIALSYYLANQPGNPQIAIDMYNDAVMQLRIQDQQLKLIEDKDQRAYVDTVKNKRSELESYLNDLEFSKHQKMRNMLLKPNPNYVDGEIETLLQGGQ